MDEPLCQGKRKYNKHRLRLGVHRPNDNKNSYSDSSSRSHILKTILTKKFKILKTKTEITEIMFKALGCLVCDACVKIIFYG